MKEPGVVITTSQLVNTTSQEDPNTQKAKSGLKGISRQVKTLEIAIFNSELILWKPPLCISIKNKVMKLFFFFSIDDATTVH